MRWWMVVAGTGERPYTEADRRKRPQRHRFPRRPKIARGDMLVSVPLAEAPTLRDIAVSTRSIGRHSHIRLTDRQGALSLEAFAVRL